MAIKLEFCNVIIPVRTIRERLGDVFLHSRLAAMADTSWHDSLLLREGCMNEHDLRLILREWESSGFELLTMIGGQTHWKDLCVVNSGYGPSHPCEWIEYDPAKNIVWLKSRPPGVPIGPAGRMVAKEE